jgi:hypothetical protein
VHACGSGGGEGGSLAEEGCCEGDAVELHGCNGLLFMISNIYCCTFKDRHAAYYYYSLGIAIDRDGDRSMEDELFVDVDCLVDVRLSSWVYTLVEVGIKISTAGSQVRH